MRLSERIFRWLIDWNVSPDSQRGRELWKMSGEVSEIEEENEMLLDALAHCGYDPDDCIDCGGPPHNEYCRFLKLRHLFPLWVEDALPKNLGHI